MKIVKLEKIRISEILLTLDSGGLVIMPTETVYGAMVDATNPHAVAKLTAYKNRPFGKPYSVAVTNANMAREFVFLNKTAKKLYKKFLPGPLTIISKGRGRVARGVEGEDGTLGIRIPKYKLVLDVVSEFKKPLTATSANASYKKRPYSISDILNNLSKKQRALIDLIIDAGRLLPNDPSTVVDTTLDDPVVLRQGEIKLTNKEEILSKGPEATKNLAKELWQKYEGNRGKRAIIFALQGDMGAGKTIFTKGLALAMQITDTVTSPSYVFEQEYGQGKRKLFHIDVWKMDKPTQELKDLKTEKLIKRREVIAIEWADKAADFIREYDDEAIIIWVKITYGKKEDERLISWGTI